MGKNSFTYFSKVLVLAVVFTFITGSFLTFINAEVNAQDKITLELAHGAPTGDPRYKTMEDIAKRIEEETNGEVEMIVHPNYTMGSEREFIEQTQMGAIDMALANPGGLSAFYDKWAVIDIPYLWPTQEHLRSVVKGPIGQKWSKEMIEARNMGVIGAFDRAPRNFITTVRPVKSPEDLDGITVRVPGWPASLAAWKAFGVEPTQTPGSEQYMAFKTGVVDAIENPYTVFLHFGHFEIGKYISETEHVRQALLLVYNNDTWNSLSEEHRSIIEEVISKAEIEHTKRVLENAQESLNTMINEHGIEFYDDVDKAAFMEKAETIYPEFLGVLEEDEREAIMLLRSF